MLPCLPQRQILWVVCQESIWNMSRMTVPPCIIVIRVCHLAIIWFCTLPLILCSQCRTVLFAFDDVLELEGTIESLFCAWRSSKGEAETRPISPPEFGCGMLWNALSGHCFLPRNSQPAFLCIFNHLQLIKCYDFLQIFNAKGAILSSSSQSSFLSSPSSFWCFPFSRPLRSKVGFEPRLRSKIVLPLANPFPDSPYSEYSPYFPASGVVPVLAAAHWDRKHLECKHQSLSWWDAFIFPKSPKNFILDLQNQNKSAVLVPGHYRLVDIQKNYSPFHSSQLRSAQITKSPGVVMLGFSGRFLTLISGKLRANDGKMMEKSLMEAYHELVCCLGCLARPWSLSLIKMASGSNRSLPHHDFLIHFAWVCFLPIWRPVLHSEARKFVKSLEVLTSCGSLLSIAAEVRAMQFRNCLRCSRITSSQFWNAWGNWPKMTKGCLTLKLSWSMKHQMVKIFLMRVQLRHTTTPQKVHSHNTMSLSVLIRRQRFVKSGKEDQFWQMAQWKRSVWSEASVSSRIPASCLLRLGHLATQSHCTPKLRIWSKGQVSESPTGLKRSWPKRSSLNMKELVFCCKCSWSARLSILWLPQ